MGWLWVIQEILDVIAIGEDTLPAVLPTAPPVPPHRDVEVVVRYHFPKFALRGAYGFWGLDLCRLFLWGFWTAETGSRI